VLGQVDLAEGVGIVLHSPSSGDVDALFVHFREGTRSATLILGLRATLSR
jgi:hypothetical protein